MELWTTGDCLKEYVNSLEYYCNYKYFEKSDLDAKSQIQLSEHDQLFIGDTDFALEMNKTEWTILCDLVQISSGISLM